MIFLYQAYQGFLNERIIIFGREHRLTVAGGPVCLLASIGALLVGVGGAWRILTDSNDELQKMFTKKSIPFCLGWFIIYIAIYYFYKID